MKGRALFVGAGFSAWAAELPVAAGLFDFAIDPFGPTEARRLDVVRTAWEPWIGGHPDEHSEQFVSWALAEGNAVRNAVLWYITRRLSEPYIWHEWHAGRVRRHVLMIDENRKYERPGVKRAQDFISTLFPHLAGIMTTNYDLLVEYALGSKVFHYGKPGEMLRGRGPYPVSQWRRPVTLRGWLPLAKLHGSISWDSELRYTDGRRGLTGNALIVAPTPEKTPPETLAGQWTLAGRILAVTSHLIVFGFGFNPYDVALLSHLKEHGSGIERVTVVDVSPNPERIERIWPNARIEAICPPPKQQTIRDWVRTGGFEGEVI